MKRLSEVTGLPLQRARRMGWSFAGKKQPSPWLTMLVLRIQHRMQTGWPGGKP